MEGGKVFIYGLASWFVPGLGHLLLRRWKRGILIGLGCLLMLIAGWRLGGSYLFEADAERGMMFWFHQLSGFGNGVIFLLHFLTGGNSTSLQIQEAVKSPTFEYGVRFLAVAGLLNYLAVLDVIDISLGRKE